MKKFILTAAVMCISTVAFAKLIPINISDADFAKLVAPYGISEVTSTDKSGKDAHLAISDDFVKTNPEAITTLKEFIGMTKYSNTYYTDDQDSATPNK